MPQTDVLVIGSGIAGLSVAIKVAREFPDRRCVIITKQESAESNTRYAQGGIAVVSDFTNDSFECHITDTLDAGDGLCDRAVVEQVVRQAPERLRELMELGADFDRDASGDLMLGREGGHKAKRIIHYRDTTGLNISTALLDMVKRLPNVTVLSHHLAIDLITGEENTDTGERTTACFGANVLDLESQKIESYLSPFTVLATGGIGQLYRTTTNPLIATGDGIAMAFRAGARVSNMEFIQFHPTAFYDLNSSPAFLISEAMRGQGAYLRNRAGERFMFRHHIDGELACRDVVSRAIDSEMQATNESYVFLDCTHIAREELLSHFPNIYETCLTRGIDISQDYIPVAPAAHYLCGGIDVDLNSRTTIRNLYACGECSNTGLHGANRLASNSLLEATVFAHNCFEHIKENIYIVQSRPAVSQSAASTSMNNGHTEALPKIKASVQSLMSKFVGIVRSNHGLEHAAGALKSMEHDILSNSLAASPEWYEVRNMITCAKLIVAQSLERKENRGGFYNKNLEVGQVLR